MIKQEYVRDFLFLLLSLYYGQGSLYEQGSILSQGIFVLILTISFFYFLKISVLNKIKTPFFKVWTILFLLNFFGFVFTGDVSNPDHFSMFKGICLTSLIFYPFYYFSQHNKLMPQHLIRFFVVLLPITILQFYVNAAQILAERISDKTEVVNNIGYSFVSFIPLIFLIKRKVVAAICMFVVLFFIIQSAKRGAFLSAAMGLICFIYFQFRKIEKRDRIKGVLLLVVIVFAMGYYVYDLYQSNEYLVNRMSTIGEEGGSSGRDIIYENIFDAWLNSDSFLSLIFGFGFAVSLDLSGTGNFAHNDWLEILSNFGLVGVSVYFLLFVLVFNKIRKNNWEIDKQSIAVVVLLICFLNTLVYRFYSAGDGYLYSIILAYLMSNNQKDSSSYFTTGSYKM
jgi:O-antigen ligase